MKRGAALAAAALALTLPMHAANAADERAEWDVLLERAFDMDGMAFLVSSGANYANNLQTPDILAQSDAEDLPVPTDRVTEITHYYMTAVAPAIADQYAVSFDANLSAQESALLLEKSADAEGKASFACLFTTAAAADGGLPFDRCGADRSPAYRTAAANFLAGFNQALSSRVLNDAFGGATCLAVDDVIAAYNTESYELNINGSVGMGAGNSRECSLLKVRWAGLAGYDWLMQSPEYGE